MEREAAVESNEEPMQSLLGSYIELCRGAREILREFFQDEDKEGVTTRKRVLITLLDR